MGAKLTCMSFCSRKMVNVINWTKLDDKGAKTNAEKKKSIILGKIM